MSTKKWLAIHKANIAICRVFFGLSESKLPLFFSFHPITSILKAQPR